MPIIELPEFTLFYSQQGSGIPVILIHGLGDTHEIWQNQIEFLTSNGFETYAIDLRGHGQSEKGPDANHTITRFAWDVIEFMNKRNIDKTHIIGHSVGSLIAQQLALNYSERIQSLVLIGSFCEHKISFLDKLQLKLSSLIPFGLAAKKFAKRPFYKPQKDWVESQIIRYKICGKKHFIGTVKALISYHACEQLSGINKPTLVLTGEVDELEPIENGKQVHDSIKGSIFKEITNAGHNIMFENSEETNSEIIKFLKSI